MMKVSIKEFLVSGEFGEIKLGMNRDRLKIILRKPDITNFKTRKHHKEEMLEYGNIEFYFHGEDDSLSSIYADHFIVLDGGNAIAVDSWKISGESSLSEVKDFFNTENISFREHPSKFTEAVILITQSAVQLGFYQNDERFEEKADWKLYNISFDGKFEPFI